MFTISYQVYPKIFLPEWDTASQSVHQKKFPSGVSVFKQPSWPQRVEISSAAEIPPAPTPDRSVAKITEMSYLITYQHNLHILLFHIV